MIRNKSTKRVYFFEEKDCGNCQWVYPIITTLTPDNYIVFSIFGKDHKVSINNLYFSPEEMITALGTGARRP